jgi:hypothetical protein
VLRTRSPVYSSLRTFSLDLHVLGTPPAFVLSQDQTLQLFLLVCSHSLLPGFRKTKARSYTQSIANLRNLFVVFCSSVFKDRTATATTPYSLPTAGAPSFVSLNDGGALPTALRFPCQEPRLLAWPRNPSAFGGAAYVAKRPEGVKRPTFAHRSRPELPRKNCSFGALDRPGRPPWSRARRWPRAAPPSSG